MPNHAFNDGHHRNRRRTDDSQPPAAAAPKPNPKILSFLLKSIIMSLILSLFLLFLGVAAIVLIHVLLAGTSLHRRRRRNTSAPTTGYSSDQLQTHLPKLEYEPSSACFAADCAVCLDNFKSGDSFRRLPACNHIFHVRCVDAWLIKVPNCPICRSPVRLDLGSSSSMNNDGDYKLLWAVGV